MYIWPLFTVTNSVPVAIVVNSWCKKVTIGEDPSVANWPTADYFISLESGSPQAQQKAGTKFTFDFGRALVPGTIVGYVQLVVSASPTLFAQVEQ